MLLTKTFSEKMQEISSETCQKKRYKKGRYHMNTDLIEKLKQYQRDYYAYKN